MNKILLKATGVIAGFLLLISVVPATAQALTLSELVELFIGLGIVPAEKAEQARQAVSGISDSGTNTGGPTNTNSNSDYGACYPFNRDITWGSTGADVVHLQNFLEDEGYLIVPAGAAKGKYGPLTQNALARYQSEKGISPASGYFGSITRVQIRDECSRNKQIINIDTSTSSMSIDVDVVSDEIEKEIDGQIQATFDVVVTAIHDDIRIPNKVNEQRDDLYKNGFDVDIVGNYNDSYYTLKSTGDAAGKDTYFIVEKGETETFEVTVNFEPHQSGVYSVSLEAMRYASDINPSKLLNKYLNHRTDKIYVDVEEEPEAVKYVEMSLNATTYDLTEHIKYEFKIHNDNVSKIEIGFDCKGYGLDIRGKVSGGCNESVVIINDESRDEATWSAYVGPDVSEVKDRVKIDTFYKVYSESGKVLQEGKKEIYINTNSETSNPQLTQVVAYQKDNSIQTTIYGKELSGKILVQLYKPKTSTFGSLKLISEKTVAIQTDGGIDEKVYFDLPQSDGTYYVKATHIGSGKTLNSVRFNIESEGVVLEAPSIKEFKALIDPETDSTGTIIVKYDVGTLDSSQNDKAWIKVHQCGTLGNNQSADVILKDKNGNSACFKEFNLSSGPGELVFNYENPDSGAKPVSFTLELRGQTFARDFESVEVPATNNVAVIDNVRIRASANSVQVGWTGQNLDGQSQAWLYKVDPNATTRLFAKQLISSASIENTNNTAGVLTFDLNSTLEDGYYSVNVGHMDDRVYKESNTFEIKNGLLSSYNAEVSVSDSEINVSNVASVIEALQQFLR